MNAVHNAFDFRWNVKAGMKAGRYTQRGHCDCQLLDLIFELQTILNIEVLPGHQRVDMTKPALLRRGSYYAEEVLRRKLPVPDPAADAAASIRERVGTAQDPHSTVQTSQRVTRGAEAINAAAENAKAALQALKNMAKQPGPQRSSQQQQVQAMLGPSTTPNGKWRGLLSTTDLQLFMSDPIVVNKTTLTKKGGAAAKRDAALRLHELAHACGVALSFYTCQTLIFDICVAEQSFLALQDAGHAELHQRLSRTGVNSTLPGGGGAHADLFQQGVPQLPDGPVSQQPVTMPSTGAGAGVVTLPPDDGNAGAGGVARAAAPRSTAEHRETDRL